MFAFAVLVSKAREAISSDGCLKCLRPEGCSAKFSYYSWGRFGFNLRSVGMAAQVAFLKVTSDPA